ESRRTLPRRLPGQGPAIRHVQHHAQERSRWLDAVGARSDSPHAAGAQGRDRGDEMTASATFRVWRGDETSGNLVDYTTPVSEGMVVLDAIHQIQADQANDLAVRWNCKAGKCGSCSAEVNGMPKLMCMTRLDALPLDQPVTVQPMQAFPSIRDLVTDVSWNFRVKQEIKPFKPRAPDAPDGTWRMQQEDIERVQEFRKCIECFLCQD